MFELVCPHCSARYETHDPRASGPASCPGCGHALLLTPQVRAEWVIGRDCTCSLIVPHPEVSHRHCRLFWLADGGYLLEDLGSTNGTYLRGHRITGPTPVRHADAVTLGPNVIMPWPSQPDALPSPPTTLAPAAETTLASPWWQAPVRLAGKPSGPEGGPQKMLVLVRWIQPDEDGRLVMWFQEVETTGAVLSPLHGPTSPLCQLDLAQDEDGLIQHESLPDQVGVRIVTESGSVYLTVLDRNDASQLAIRLERDTWQPGQDPDLTQAEAALRSMERQGAQARKRPDS